MDGKPTADTQSPWYEAYAVGQEGAKTYWLAGTEYPVPLVNRVTQPAEDNWATAALFECYNG